MMYIDNEVLEKMIMTIVEGFDRIEKKLDRMNRLKDCLDGDTLLDNCDLAQLLGVTQRTIARYRERGLSVTTRPTKTERTFIVVRRSGSFCSRKERKNPEYCFVSGSHAGHGITASLYRAREAVCLICPIPELDSP